MELDEEVKTIHALLLAFPVPTHLTPLLQLARRLSSVSPATHKFVFTSIVSYSTAAAGGGGGGGRTGELQDEEFTLRTIAVPDGLPLSHPRTNILDIIKASENMRAPTEMFIPQLQQTQPRLSCIISDVFVQWAVQLAASFSIPLFSFYTSNASSACILAHAPSLVSQGIIPLQESSQHNPVKCPGVLPILPQELPFSMQLPDVSHPHLQFTLKMFSKLEESKGLILNTCYDLEADAIDALKARCPVYTVGPLFLGDARRDDPGLRAPPKRNECLAWLDAQAASSVVYVSFGTLATFSADQIKELAMGLEDSKVPFLWVIRKNSVNGSMSEVLPDGFVERMKDRCLVTSWAPQVEVLKHGAVGGFFSHCGWNSVLENFALNGVPMLCWPDKAEQGVNARLLVHVWKLGLQFKLGKESGVISRGDVDVAVRALMQGQAAARVQMMRQRGAQLKELVLTSVKQGGSSYTNFHVLLQNI